MQRSDTIGKLGLALSKAQKEITGARKDANNPFFKSKYADLASVQDAIKDALSSNEIAFTQFTENDDSGNVVVETMLIHSSGEWIASKLAMKPVKPDPQSIGSCITYARRYALAAICGVAQVDDDGSLASGQVISMPKQLTQDQKQSLNSLIEEAKPDINALCSHFKINSIAEINSINYEPIMGALKAKKKNQVKQDAAK